MKNFIIQMGLSMALGILAETIKNPKSKTKEKKTLLEIYKTCNALSSGIRAAYPGDSDFE